MSGRSKNRTLKGGTSPYSLCMVVPPPPSPRDAQFMATLWGRVTHVTFKETLETRGDEIHPL